ncbi:MAG: ATP-binding protein, partial [Candidatus Dormibacteraceae bacterium]
MDNYLPRVADSVLEACLRSAGGVLIEGPRACGKTATARRFAASEALLDSDPTTRAYLDIDPYRVLKGESPRLIDEWQVQPLIWNLVRREIDDRQSKGQFILTGSAIPPDDITRHTGAGRILRMRMRTMSLFESGHSTGEVSVAGLLKGEHAYGDGSGITFDDVVERIAVGGWPAQIRSTAADALPTLRGYVDEVTHAYMQTVDGRLRNPERVRRVMNSLARNVATEVKLSTIAADIAEEDAPIKAQTVEEYLSGLVQLMVVEDQTAWAPRLRSRSRVRSTPKRHFTDPSLAVACLGKDVDGLLQDLEWV